jgi:chromosome transmission fidelity protein 18
VTCRRYAPALRELRGVAEIFKINKVAPERLVERMRTICQRERGGVPTATLWAVAEQSDGDVRSCVNTLQVAALVVALMSKRC